jgi:hypothetical protein
MIISLSGMIGSGKDTVADYLCDNHGFTRMSFAKYVKDVVSIIFGWDREMLEGRTEEARRLRDEVDVWWTDNLDLGVDVTPRWVLQYFGTEVMRNKFHPDIWVLAAEQGLRQNEGKNLVFTDSRFLNELAMLQRRDAILVGIYRKPVKWLEDFYRKVERFSVAEFKVGFQELDISRPGVRETLAEYATEAIRQLAIQPAVHRSEYEHLVWPMYDTLIDNSGSLQKTYDQIEKLLR